LEKALREHESLMAQFAEQKQALEKSNSWAESMNREVARCSARIAELQDEMAREQEAARRMAAGYEASIMGLEADVAAKAQWARDAAADVEKQTAELVKAVGALHETEKVLEERTAWALRLQEQTDQLMQQMALVRASRWMRFGRKVGLGPVIPPS
jgi:chromosome segregation ATPase